MPTSATPSTNLWLNLDGETVPLDDIIWEAVGSCGCPFAWHVAVSQGNVLSATVEAAKDQLFENRVERAYNERAGVTVRPVRRGEINPRHECDHTPRYGLPDADAPEGHEWATTDMWWRGRQTHLRHIIPALDPNADQYRTSQTKALCGKDPSRSRGIWRTDATDAGTHVRSKVPCAKCTKAVSR